MAEFFVLTLCFFAAFPLSLKVMMTCANAGMMNKVTDRSSHKKETPRGGGLAIVIITLLMWAVLIGLLFPVEKMFWLTLMAGSILVAWIGWRDDKKSQPAKVRLTVHLVAVALGLAFMPQMFEILPFWADRLLMFLAWGWFINLFNFMDGIDGLAATEAAFLGTAIGFFVPGAELFGLAVAGASLGFLAVNWSPAKIFMGDVGSTFLGYVLGGLLIYGAAADPEPFQRFYPLFILPLVFTGDATYTLIKRLLKGQKPWHAHREHFYQRAATLGLGHDQVVRGTIFLNIFLFLLALFGYGLHAGAWILLPAFILMILAACRVRYLEGK